MTVEALLAEVRSCGLFQTLMTTLVFGCKGLAGWSTMVMAFAGAAPSWHCAGSNSSSNASLGCPGNDSITCTPLFSTDRNTAVSQWGLVCQEAWVPDVITSVQMAGLLLGAAVSGQLGDVIGRKWTLFFTLVLHAGLNVGAGLSSSWQMFAAFRFLTGCLIGSILVLAFVFPVEFLAARMRSALPFVPAWAVGSSLFALTAWRLHAWDSLHFVLAGLHLPFLLAVFLLPESLRWLLTQGRLEDAQRCLATVARINGASLPGDSRQRLAKVVEELQQQDRDVKGVTYLDLVRHWPALKSTLVVSLSWFTLSLVYYGLSFSARSLAGNLYLNIFLISIVDLAAFAPMYLLINSLGRRWTVALSFFLTCAASLSIVLASLQAQGQRRDTAVKVLAFVAKAAVSAAWAAHQTFVSELYPTRVRNLGYGWANTAARVGGIVAPFAINMDSQTRLVVSYVVAAALTLLSGAVNLTLAETKGRALQDSLATLKSSIFSAEVEAGPGDTKSGQLQLASSLVPGSGVPGNGAEKVPSAGQAGAGETTPVRKKAAGLANAAFLPDSTRM